MLSYCRYYRGESECPSSDSLHRTFWTMESEWVHQSPAEDGQIPPVINAAMEAYFQAGLAIYKLDDPTPISLRAYMFLRMKGTSAPITPLVVDKYKALYDAYMKGGQ